MIRTLLILILSLTCSINISVGQITPGTLRNNEIQNELIKNTIQFDSIILVDISSYWKDDHSISGIGFINTNAYKVTVMFNTLRDSTVRLEYKKLKKNEIKNHVLLAKLKDINITKLKALNTDSLEIKTRTGVYADMSDGSEWSLLLIDKKENKVFLKQAYMPDMYVMTNDKQLFINTIKEIETLLTK